MVIESIIAVFGVLGLLSVINFLKHRTPTPNVLDAGLKGIASLFFVFISATVLMFSFSKEYICSENKLRGIFLVTVGAFFGLIGDMLLDLKCVYKKEDDFFLKAGFSAFFLGHLAYTFSLIFSGNLFKRPIALLALLGVSLIIGFISVNIEKELKVSFGKYKPIVALYSGVIFLTVNVSILNLFTDGFTIENILIYLGLLIILGSDAILNRTYFGEGCNTKTAIILNHVLYYIGQYLIALSTYFVIK